MLASITSCQLRPSPSASAQYKSYCPGRMWPGGIVIENASRSSTPIVRFVTRDFIVVMMFSVLNSLIAMKKVRPWAAGFKRPTSLSRVSVLTASVLVSQA